VRYGGGSVVGADGGGKGMAFGGAGLGEGRLESGEAVGPGGPPEAGRPERGMAGPGVTSVCGSVNPHLGQKSTPSGAS